MILFLCTLVVALPTWCCNGIACFWLALASVRILTAGPDRHVFFVDTLLDRPFAIQLSFSAAFTVPARG